jgi:hypothetical protein
MGKLGHGSRLSGCSSPTSIYLAREVSLLSVFMSKLQRDWIDPISVAEVRLCLTGRKGQGMKDDIDWVIALILDEGP